MSPTPMRHLALPVFLLAMCASAHAAPPLATNDADVLESGACQAEAEFRRFRSSDETDLIASCGFLGNLEAGIGSLRSSPDGQPRQESVGFGGKWLWVAPAEDTWGLGIGAELIRASGSESGMRQYGVLGLATRRFEETAVHLNLGFVDDRQAEEGTRRRRASWGVAVEHEMNDRWTLLAEVSGQHGLSESGLVGLRWWILPRHVQLFAGAGAERGAGKEGRWLSLGIRLETGRPIF